ncbi:zinc ribbon domain-containing protein [Moorena sp. SIO4E2]|uniref:zinc ribbon domain-containing protein n=1 Tax=Moorena sp. SIO4E2 TaxID=2607826 RepID=UPI00257F19C9|nr:zinc ribbon domain-containing protein [Moorena sp. SIO4E2]
MRSRIEGNVLVEINRWFPSSKTCSNCHYRINELPLDVRLGLAHICVTHHDRDGNAPKNIRGARFQDAILLWDGRGQLRVEKE